VLIKLKFNNLNKNIYNFEEVTELLKIQFQNNKLNKNMISIQYLHNNIFYQLMYKK